VDGNFAVIFQHRKMNFFNAGATGRPIVKLAVTTQRSLFFM
jgi:hypothetical protein